jgi:hypothetical protein
MCGEITTHRKAYCVCIFAAAATFFLSAAAAAAALCFSFESQSLYISLLSCKCVFVNEEKERKFLSNEPKKYTKRRKSLYKRAKYMVYDDDYASRARFFLFSLNLSLSFSLSLCVVSERAKERERQPFVVDNIWKTRFVLFRVGVPFSRETQRKKKER